MKKVILTLIFIFLLPATSFASDTALKEIYDSVDISSFEESIPREIIKKMEEAVNTEGGKIPKINLQGLLRKAADFLFDGLNEIKGLFLELFVLCVFDVFALSLISDEEIRKSAGFAFKLTAAIVFLKAFISLAKESCLIVNSSVKLMYGFLPLFCALNISGGHKAATGIFGPAMLMFCEITGTFFERIFIPFIVFFILLSLGAVFSSSFLLGSIAKGICKTIKCGLSALASLMVFLLTLSNSLGNMSDGIALKAAGAVTGAFVPVIGSAVKDALSSFKGCMNIISSSLGGIFIVAALLIFLPSILKMFLLKAGMSVFEALFSSFSSVGDLAESFKSSADIILALEFFTFFIMIVSVSLVVLTGLGG